MTVSAAPMGAFELGRCNVPDLNNKRGLRRKSELTGLHGWHNTIHVYRRFFQACNGTVCEDEVQRIKRHVSSILECMCQREEEHKFDSVIDYNLHMN